MSTRRRVEQAVQEHPGISFSDLKRETGLANGALQYHIHHSDRITKEKGGLVPRGFCDRCALQDDCRDSCIRNLLQDTPRRRILKGLMKGKTQTVIAEDLDLDPSTVSYHVTRLREAGVLDGRDPVPGVEQFLDI